ncbi:PAS domain S-box protein [Algoriphagus mannitolivorans]|uniref:PAS domain S-box protein n=1 Tax=Algoriphagus mannitolivorans TaxID=226504 RepID=UPI00040414C6|nr:PAS domain S-box protein [Algoriphagus mannitolivorans]
MSIPGGHLDFSSEHIDRVFPFHFGLDESAMVICQGSSLQKLLGDIQKKRFDKLFEIVRPGNVSHKLDHLKNLENQTILLKIKDRDNLLFRGQFDYYPDSKLLMFWGTPWFNSIEEVVETNLSLSDFAPVDPLIDLLHLVKNHELVTEDLKHLVDTVNVQKEKLKELSYVASANSNGILYTDEKGNITYVNQGFLKMTGFEEKEVLGKTPVELGKGPETDLEEIQKMLQAFFSLQPFKVELKHYRKDGTWFWARINGQIMRDNEEKFLNCFSLIEDITEEKKSKERLKTFEQTFQKVLEFSGDNVWEHDFRTEKTQFSNLSNNFLGLDVQEATDLAKFWYESIVPEDLTLLQENDRKYRAGEISSHELVYRIRHRNGAVKWVLDRGIVIEKNSKGKPIKIIGTHSDITRQKESEQELLAVNKKLESVLFELKDVIWAVTFPELESIFFTPSAEDLFELKMETIMKDNSWILPLIYEKDHHVFHEIIQEAVEKKEFSRELRLKTSSGKIKWIHVKGRLTEEDGGALRLNGILSDISERKRTEELLEAQENLKNILIELSTTYINMDLQEVDEKIQASLKRIGEFVDADRAYVFSYDLKAMTCSCNHEWCAPGIAPQIQNTQQVSLNDIPEWLEAHRRGESFFVPEVSALKEQGFDQLQGVLEEQGIKSLIAIPMILGKELVGFVGFDSVRHSHKYSQKEVELLFVFAQMLINVQTRKQSELRIIQQEEKFRNIISNMSLGLLEVDNEETVLHANQTFCEMAGYRMEDLIGTKATDLLLTEESKKTLLKKSASRKYGNSDSYELQYKKPDGELRWWHVSGAPNYNDNGQLIGSIGIHLDITAQKKLEKELIRQREEAEKSRRSKELFFANMSHEIRTPMNAIVGMGEQLAKTPLNESQKGYLSAIQVSANHLMVVLKDILDLSKLEAGKMTLEVIGFDLKEVLGRAKKMMTPKAEEKGLSFSIREFDPRISKVLKGDPFRINQIILNLVSNSIKFTKKGKVTMACRLIEDHEQVQVISLEVEDTGIGMDTEFISGDFAKYVQEDSSITRKYGGTGLGLSITKELINLMEGEMRITSQKSEGTQIHIILPLEKGVESDLPVERQEQLSADPLKGKRILVVDDNDFNRLLALTILEQYQVECFTANNGKEAIDKVKSTDLDLILMDIQMPVMDGVKATHFIRNQLHADMPIIALTAFALKGDEQKYLNQGMNGFISKPFQEKDLILAISRVLGHQPEIQEATIESKEPVSEVPRYSLDELNQIAKGNEDFVQKMIEIFCTNAKEGMKEIREAFDSEDYDTVRKVAHKIKPSIKMMRIREISEEVVELEKQILSEKNSPKMTQIILHMEDILQWVVQDIQLNTK